MNTCRHCGIILPGTLTVCGPCTWDLIAPGLPTASLLVQPLHDDFPQTFAAKHARQVADMAEDMGERERDAYLSMPDFPTSETTDGDW